ncbi:hypothetical protein EB796_013280 [Bugula neritina]|uniref:O-acyltransferase WSD1-like N-terminal domain-containing protein n=1 Tax=Bugula neritina TaxID=10212 RepID=A0A7J7JRX7_BUGNE|nr:hypothetical protein EB796_013280 [Bugula neritina]
MESLWIMSDDRPLTFKELRLQRQRNTSVGVDAEGNPLIQGVKAENDAVKVEEVNMQSGREAAGMSHDPSRTMTRNIHSVVVVLEKSLDVEALIQTIQQRLISLKKSDSNERYFPKFTQKLVEIAGGSLVWVDDSNFALSRHVLVHTQPVRNQADMQTFLEAQTRQGIPVDAPLWQLVIASGYGTLQDRVLVWRFHGAMYDGVTLAKILTFTLTNPHNILFRAHDQYFHRNDHLVTFYGKG